MKYFLWVVAIALAVQTLTDAQADEGMWQPHQLQELSKELKRKGLKIDPKKMANLNQFPMNAIISLGGCTASFVSPKGLVVTNHHCAYGSIQYNSTEQNNLLAKGFVAKSLDEELQAAPGSRVYVTESVINVTDKISGAVDASLTGADYYAAIEAKEKALVAQCESSDDYRCEIYSFHGGMEYYLIKALAIRDVRVVYAPPSSIGKFGGDTDNWMWPRHTGDWAFYRAYVGKDGKPADYSEDNVPFEPKTHLKVNAHAVDKDEFVMVLGYPGRTNRYRTAKEVMNQFNWIYPNRKEHMEAYIDVIKTTAAEGSEARIKYQSLLAGLANYAKNYGSMVESYHKGDMLERKQKLEKELLSWISKSSSKKEKYGPAIQELDKLIEQSQDGQATDLMLRYMSRANMWSTADRLYRLAHERTKPNADREPGYQERDMNRFEQGMKRIDRRYDSKVEQAVLMYFLEQYSKLDIQDRIPALDKFFGIENGFNKQKVSKKLADMHSQTELNKVDTRLAWMNKSVEEFKTSKDPYIQFAVSQYESKIAREQEQKDLIGDFQRVRPAYMEAIIAYKKSKGEPVYADANSSLRITYGSVKGYSPKDGIYATPFTTLEGMLAKYIPGDEEFDMPKKLIHQIEAKNYDGYQDKQLGSVPVNYLSTVDTTGGNSGSPTLNGKGEFVGLLFDGVYESIIGDWDYDKNLNRSIHVSSSYMLWVMEHVDGAQNIIDEMSIVK